MTTLIKGVNAVGRVIDVKERIDSFKDTKSETGGWRYCHGFSLDVDGLEYPCQYCTTSEHLTDFAEGDLIDFVVKSFSRNVHTIGLNHVLVSDRKTTSALPASKHINLAGTPEAIGLQCAAQIYANRLEIDEIAIVELAHSFTMYLRSEYETNTNPQ